MPETQQQHDRTGSERPAGGGRWWLAFTGLIPVGLVLPFSLAHAWTIATVVALAAVVAVIGYHLLRRQSIGALDLGMLVVGVTNLVLLAVWHQAILLQHLDLVVYSLLAAQALVSLGVGEPWTTPYARRTTPPEVWTTPAFHLANRVSTTLWAAAFLACDAAAVLLPGPLSLLVPAALLVAAAVATRPVALAAVRRLGGS